MIRFRTLLFLLSLSALTAAASYFFFDPFCAGKPDIAVLDANSDNNPYDDDFFTPDNSGLQSSRQKGIAEENSPLFSPLLSAEPPPFPLFACETPQDTFRRSPVLPYVKYFLSVCQPVRAGPSSV